jgi:predicted ATPase
MVNEGFGINQLVHMLTVCLYSKTKVIAIEEPEIHLHPSMVRKLVHAMVDITSKNDKRIIVSTHSETFVLSLLAQIADGKISVDDVSFIFAEKEDGESKFTKQEASSDGQIQGGLSSFMEAELEDMAIFFGQSPETI